MDCGLWKEKGFDFKDSFLSIIYIYIYIWLGSSYTYSIFFNWM